MYEEPPGTIETEVSAFDSELAGKKEPNPALFAGADARLRAGIVWAVALAFAPWIPVWVSYPIRAVVIIGVLIWSWQQQQDSRVRRRPFSLGTVVVAVLLPATALLAFGSVYSASEFWRELQDADTISLRWAGLALGAALAATVPHFIRPVWRLDKKLDRPLLEVDPESGETMGSEISALIGNWRASVEALGAEWYPFGIDDYREALLRRDRLEELVEGLGTPEAVSWARGAVEPLDEAFWNQTTEALEPLGVSSYWWDERIPAQRWDLFEEELIEQGYLEPVEEEEEEDW